LPDDSLRSLEPSRKKKGNPLIFFPYFSPALYWPGQAIPSFPEQPVLSSSFSFVLNPPPRLFDVHSSTGPYLHLSSFGLRPSDFYSCYPTCSTKGASPKNPLSLRTCDSPLPQLFPSCPAFPAHPSQNSRKYYNRSHYQSAKYNVLHSVNTSTPPTLIPSPSTFRDRSFLTSPQFLLP